MINNMQKIKSAENPIDKHRIKYYCSVVYSNIVKLNNYKQHLLYAPSDTLINKLDKFLKKFLK